MKRNYKVCRFIVRRHYTSLLLAITAVVLSLWASVPAAAMAVTVHISDHSTRVTPTHHIDYDVDIKYPENTSLKDLRITAELKQGNEIIASAKSLRAVETQLSFVDHIAVPQNTKKGNVELTILVEDYAGLHQEASATFRVTGSDPAQEGFGILFLTIIVIGIAVSIEILWLARRRSAKG